MSFKCCGWWLLTMSMGLIGCQSHESPTALGTLERDRVLLKATAAELITQLPFPQGVNVNTGDLLVQLDNRRQLSVVAKAEASLASAEASLSKIRRGARQEDVAAARALVQGEQAQLIEAEKAFDRTASLVAQKLAGAAQLDAARARRDSRQAAVEHARENVYLLENGSRPEDVKQAEAQVALAQASLALERQALEDLSIRATRTGRLDLLPKHQGERVLAGETLAVLLADRAPYARVYIPESARVHLRVGQELPVHIDGLAEPLVGVLRWVAQDAAFTPYFALNSADRSRLVYAAEVQLADAAEHVGRQ